MIFQVLIIGMLLLLAAGLAYLLTRLRKFRLFRRLAAQRRWLGWVVVAAVLLVIIAFAVYDLVNTVIVLLHLMLFFAFFDLLFFLIRKISHREFKMYYEGVLAIVLTAVYLCSGWYLAHHVFETHYALTTEKNIGKDMLRIVQISDSHIGNTFDGKGFSKHLERIQRTNPDVVVITGDYVDDDTTMEDMTDACAALGRLQTTYGVYFVFGNHDKGYYMYRHFSAAELKAELAKNNVRVLEDESVMLGEDIVLVGRKDRSDSGRKSAAELTAGVDDGKYTIILDHQPGDFDAESAAGADLVLCGHTHGGQMFPAGFIGVAIGANDRAYGMEEKDGTVFIVNSGISCWAIQFKTATISEYTVIDITRE